MLAELHGPFVRQTLLYNPYVDFSIVSYYNRYNVPLLFYSFQFRFSLEMANMVLRDCHSVELRETCIQGAYILNIYGGSIAYNACFVIVNGTIDIP